MNLLNVKGFLHKNHRMKNIFDRHSFVCVIAYRRKKGWCNDGYRRKNQKSKNRS